ncbi:hypothetical protein TNCV_2501091 [Trichonephila clavipes]|nr:hypothetical protein TNCV_2501091 [Trichonephila clavipes]
MGRTILLERRQSESVGRRNSRTTFLRSDWPRPFARREVGVEMELGRSENKLEIQKISCKNRDSRFDRRGDMTSITNWSERTDSTVTLTTTTGLGASPSQVTTGDELIAEKSDLFREAIRARNVYAAWARKLTNARPNDPKLQDYHQEVTKAGERVNLLLSQLDVPLFRIPASEKELDKILIRLKNKPIDPPVVKNQKSKTAAVPPHPRLSPVRVKRRESEALILKASLPQAAC